MANIRIPDGAGGHTEITEPVRTDFPANLNGALQYTLSHWIYAVLSVMGEGLATFAGSFFVQFLNILEPEMIDFVDPLIDLVLAAPDLSPELRHYFTKLQAGGSQAGAALAGALGTSAAGASLTSIITPLLTVIGQGAWTVMPINLFDAGTQAAVMWRGHQDRARYEEALRMQGFAEPSATALEDVIRPRTTIPDWVQYVWRHPDQEGEFRDEMVKRGFLTEDIDRAMELMHLVPGPGDLITMAVREAWRDDVAAKYGLDEDYVAAFGENMSKQGYDEEWSRRWWRAHWQLPSIGQAREMLWRTPMTDDDFSEYLRFADLPSKWRGWMGEIAYRTLTRVDIRRMHAMGVLSDDDIVKSYADFGYNAENAANMAEFTVRYNAENDRDVTKTDLLRGYRLGVLTRSEATTGLVELNYSPSTADYYLSLEEYKYSEELADEEISVVQTLYQEGQIDKSTATGRLSAVGLTSTRMDRLFEKWDIRRAAKVERPTRGELERFVKQGLLTQSEYGSQMSDQGYNDGLITMYYASILLELEQVARVEEARTAKEAERIREDEERTEYQLAKANLDYQIAQERLHLQQVRTAVTLYADKDEVEALMASIQELQRDIAALGLVIAGKRTDIRTAQAALRDLGVSPDLTLLYTQIDALNVQITEGDAAIAELRVLSAEAQAAVRVARLPTAVVDLTETIAAARAQIAIEQAIIAGLRVTIAEAQQALTRLGIPEQVQDLYALVDQAQIAIAQQRAEQAGLRVDLVVATIAASWEAPVAEVEAVREQIDALEISVRTDFEDVADLKLQVAEIKAQVAGMLDSEEIAELEADMGATQERIRQLQIDRARLRVTYA